MSNSDYMEMIELPVSTCEIVVSPKRKKPSKRIFKRVTKSEEIHKNEKAQPVETEPVENSREDEESNVVLYEKKEKKKFKVDIVAAQVTAIFVLVVAIILTNVFWEESGINTILKSVFKTEKQTTDARSFNVFSAALPSGGTIELNEGVMTIMSSGAVYSPVEGEVESVSENEGKFSLTLKHSDSFRSLITGLDHLYAEQGERVYKGIPVGYAEADCKVTMYDGDKPITNYTIDGGSIVWEK